MLDIGYSELFMVGLVALVVIGPKELPNALRQLGKFTGKARAMSRHLRAGFDEMVRQAEIEEMEKQWAEHNARIMAEHPTAEDYVAPEEPATPTSSDSVTDTPPATSPAPDEQGHQL